MRSIARLNIAWRPPGLLVAAGMIAFVGLTACVPDDAAARSLAFESEWLSVYVGPGVSLCGGSSAELERQAEAIRGVVGMERGVVDVDFGEDLTEDLCANRFDVRVAGCYVSEEDRIGATRASFAHEYVHALQRHLQNVHPFWAEGGAEYYTILGLVSMPRGSFPSELKGSGNLSPLALLALPRDEFRSEPRSYEVASHFFFYLEDRFGRAAVRDFHASIWTTSDVEEEFARAFGTSIDSANADWIANSLPNYAPEAEADPVQFCQSFVELPLRLAGAQACSEPTVIGSSDVGTLGTQDVCFVLQDVADLRFDLGDGTSPHVALELEYDRNRPCDGPAPPEAFQPQTLGAEDDGSVFTLAACTWRVRVGTNVGSEDIAFDLALTPD